MIRVLVVGCGNMGASHAKAYHLSQHFQLVGLVSKGDSKNVLNQQFLNAYPVFDDYEQALKVCKPDAVCISTYPDTHESFAVLALELGCHVFVEKPLATTVEGALRVKNLATKKGLQVVVGYILRHHPTWVRFVAEAQKLGKPLVMRMNLNQQSHGNMWDVHKNLMQSLSPIVDCGVHYLDVMCQMTQAAPLSVSAIGVRLTDEIPENQYNYGQLQIRFEDGSVGWYEAGWGPMMSETAYFVKDVIGPKGAVSIVSEKGVYDEGSDDIDRHTKSDTLKIHHSSLGQDGKFKYPDDWIRFSDDPSHQELCNAEQEFFYEAISHSLDLSAHLESAVRSLQIALACDKAVKTKETVKL